MYLDPDADRRVTRVDGAEAAALVRDGVMVLDVRTPDEFTGLGHIPGARLLPVHLVASAPAMLGDVDGPVLVCCEHAVRSRGAARLLAQAGFTRVYELGYGMAEWTGDRAFEEQPIFGPAPWLVDNADLLPRTAASASPRPAAPRSTPSRVPGSGSAGSGDRTHTADADPRGPRTLDVACGAGRHALLLAAAGFDVTAVDRDRAALDRLRATAERLDLRLQVDERDLETPDATLGDGLFDLIIVTRYLHRPLMPHLVRALAPGGTLVYETFLAQGNLAQESLTQESLAQEGGNGHTTNPRFLLQPGELATLVHPLKILRSREGDFDGDSLSSVIARRTADV
jgi:rhodanese-related sulfurtransferase/SAM-dependent methyltransferase